MQVKVWLLGISLMVWRRVLVSSTCTLGELHGVIQVAMGWEGIHLYHDHGKDSVLCRSRHKHDHTDFWVMPTNFVKCRLHAAGNSIPPLVNSA